MQPESSSPCSQEPATGPCSEPDQSSPEPYRLPYSFEIQLNTVLPSTTRSRKWSLPFRLSDKRITGLHFLSLPCMLHALPISSELAVTWKRETLCGLLPLCCGVVLVVYKSEAGASLPEMYTQFTRWSIPVCWHGNTSFLKQTTYSCLVIFTWRSSFTDEHDPLYRKP
jgi:hypothetical protein